MQISKRLAAYHGVPGGIAGSIRLIHGAAVNDYDIRTGQGACSPTRIAVVAQVPKAYGGVRHTRQSAVPMTTPEPCQSAFPALILHEINALILARHHLQRSFEAI